MFFAELGYVFHGCHGYCPFSGLRYTWICEAITVVVVLYDRVCFGECDCVTIFNDLIYTDECRCAVVRGHLDFKVSDVYQSLDDFEFSVAVAHCGARWCVTVVVSIWHATYCAFGHCCHLGTSVDNGIDIALVMGQYSALNLAYSLRQRCSCLRTDIGFVSALVWFLSKSRVSPL